MLIGLGKPVSNNTSIERAIDLKMSKSKPDSAIFMTDSEEEIKSEKFTRYRIALRKLPYLNRLRKDFIGRVIHISEKSWRKGVQDILAISKEKLD